MRSGKNFSIKQILQMSLYCGIKIFTPTQKMTDIFDVNYPIFENLSFFLLFWYAY